MIVAVFEWGDGYVETVVYPKKPIKLKHNGTKPDTVKILIKDAKIYKADMSEWFSTCYSVLGKVVS